jgi:hypothetical protein
MESDSSNFNKSISTIETSSGSFRQENFLYIELDYIRFVAGERATGEVLINLPKPVDGCFLRFICVGTEELTIYDTTEQVMIQERREILAIRSTLKTWNEYMPAGQFVFPFSFKIPHFAPATFYYEGEDSTTRRIKARVEYHIEAMLESISSAEIKCSSRRELQVCNRMIRSKTEYSADLNEAINCLCFFKGNTNLSLKIANSDHPSIGSSSKFVLVIDNSGCSTAISHFEVKLVMQLSPGDAIANEQNFYSSREVWKATLLRQVDAGGQFSQEGVVDVNFEEMLNPGSNSGVLIKCFYQLVAVVTYCLPCGSSDVTISLPIHINPRNKVVREAPMMPETWNPQEFSIHNLVAASSLRGYDSQVSDYQSDAEPMIFGMPSS